MQAIGDSAQGAANAVLFVLLTKRVRTTVFSLSYWKLKLKLHRSRSDSTEDGETDPFLKDKARTVNRHSITDSTSEIFTPARVSAEESNIFTFPVKNV